MSDTAAAAPPAYFVLPGFVPDVVLFAARMTLAMLLAYYVAFFAQVESASTAGICVAIVTQVSAGMSAAKVRYRIVGILIGGCIGLGLVAGRQCPGQRRPARHRVAAGHGGVLASERSTWHAACI